MKPSETVKEAISLYEFWERFPDEAAAVEYVESKRWPDGACCPKCGSTAASAVKSAKAPCRGAAATVGSISASGRVRCLPSRRWASTSGSWRRT